MKKIIGILIIAGAIYTPGIEAMGQGMLSFTAKASRAQGAPTEEFELEKDHALLAITLNDMYQAVQEINEAIPLGRATQDEVEALLNGRDYNYILSVHEAYNEGRDANPVVIRGLSDEERKKRSKIKAQSLDPVLYGFSAEALMQARHLLQAARYLNIPELTEKYARIIAIMLSSDASMGLLARNNQEHSAQIRAMAQSQFSELILSYIPQIWYAEHTLAGHGVVQAWAASYSPDSTHIVTVFNDNTAKIWDARTGALEHTLANHTLAVWSASYSPDGTHIVTASNDKTAKIWDARTGTLEYTLAGHTDSVKSASYSPDGAHIVTASDDGTAKIWNARTGALEHTLAGNLASYSQDGAHIVTASDDKTAKIWNAGTGALEHTLAGHTNWVRSASYSPDGAHIVTASDDKTAKIWNARTGACEHTLEGHDYWLGSAHYSPDGAHIVTASDGGTAKIWNAQTGALEHTLAGHTDWGRSAHYSPDGAHVVAPSYDMTAKIWNARTGALEHTLAGHTALVKSASYSPNGAHIVTASLDGTAKIWSLMPAHTMEQALLLHYLTFIKTNGGHLASMNGWTSSVMSTYASNERALIERVFPAPASRSSSSSSSTNNN